MMNLKESYRYANFLDMLFNNANNLLLDRDFITTKKIEHLRKKANKDAEDETVIGEKPYDVEPIKVVNFAVQVLEEREKLHNAIALAKKEMELNMDVVLSANKTTHTFIKTLSNMADTRPSTSQNRECDYMFNSLGDQVKYYYPTETTVTINFDRNEIKGLMKRLQRETDEKSTKLDMLEITTQVNYEHKWDVNDSFDELIEEFANAK